jgi:zinc transport system permease protein
MMPEFLLYALICGVGVALVAGPLGAFMVWRSMAYFGDTLAHAALMGAALGVMLNVQPMLAVLISSLLLALLLVALQSERLLANDTVLGILSHSTLALGLVCSSMVADQRIDLWALLFGDLLTVTPTDIAVVYGVATVVLLILWRCWRGLIFTTVDENLARVEGIATDKLRLLLMSLIALVVALAMKVVGVLLITALLIIPAAASRRFSQSPEDMAVGASLIGALSVILGLGVSFMWDIPTGPTIVLATSAFFVLSLAARR